MRCKKPDPVPRVTGEKDNAPEVQDSRGILKNDCVLTDKLKVDA
jgi:hypothetical protein